MKSIIIYATKYGSVEKTAKMLQEKMHGDVHMINILQEKVPSLDEYDSVIFGGSIYMGKIQGKLTDYLVKNQAMLLNKKIGLFICAGLPTNEAKLKELSSVFPQELYEHAVVKEVFGYEINYNKLNFFERIVMKAVKGDKNRSAEFFEENIDRFAKAIL